MVKPVSLFEASSGKTFATEFEAHKDDLIGSLTAAGGNGAVALAIVEKLSAFEALHTVSEAIIGMMVHHPQTPAAAPCPVEAAIMPELRDCDQLPATPPDRTETRNIIRRGGYCDVPGMNGRGDW